MWNSLNVIGLLKPNELLIYSRNNRASIYGGCPVLDSTPPPQSIYGGLSYPDWTCPVSQNELFDMIFIEEKPYHFESLVVWRMSSKLKSHIVTCRRSWKAVLSPVVGAEKPSCQISSELEAVLSPIVKARKPSCHLSSDLESCLARASCVVTILLVTRQKISQTFIFCVI